MNLPKNITLTFDGGTLLLHGITQQNLSTIHLRALWTWDPRVNAWRCDAIHYPAIRNCLAEKLADRFTDQIPAPPRVTFKQVELPKLRPEQNEALNAWNRADRRGQIIMPTGTGKTEVALAAMARCQIATLIVAPVRDLMYQWHRRILHALACDAGIVGDNLHNLKPVTVTTYDSAYIHMDKMGDKFGLLIFDEEHHLPGRCRREAALLSTASWRMGLTATPQRADGRHADLDELIGPIVYSLPLDQVRGTTLADFDVVRIPVAPSKADSPPVVDADAVLTVPVATQALQPVARRHAQVREALRRVQEKQLPECGSMHGDRWLPPRIPREQALGVAVTEALDQDHAP